MGDFWRATCAAVTCHLAPHARFVHREPIIILNTIPPLSSTSSGEAILSKSLAMSARKRSTNAPDLLAPSPHTSRGPNVALSPGQDINEHEPRHDNLSLLRAPTCMKNGVDERNHTYPACTPEHSRPVPISRACSARLELKPDRFAMVDEVWRGIKDTHPEASKSMLLNKKRRSTLDSDPLSTRQSTLDGFLKKQTTSFHQGPNVSVSPPDSLSSCSTVPSDSDDELASPARKWIRTLGSSPTEWLNPSSRPPSPRSPTSLSLSMRHRSQDICKSTRHAKT